MPDDDEKNQQNTSDVEEKESRMDAAKAFFRSMYAGDEPVVGDNAPSGETMATESRRVKELEHEIKELEQRAIDAENLYKRMAADFDNFRRRIEREREDFTNAGVRKAAVAIIPVLDDLDRAMLYLSPDTPTEKVIESFQLVANRVIHCLDQAGLKRLSTKGVLFDPHFHEPVQHIETTDAPDGTIVHELRAGYVLGDRVIRPALVNVALNHSINIEPVAELKAETRKDASPAKPAFSVVTATEEMTEKATQSGVKTPSSEPEDRVYDLGDL